MKNDIELLRRSLAVAKRSMEKENLPFGCLLADADGNVLEEGENTVITADDSIGHCEINLIHQLAGKYSTRFLNSCTLYASTEPCPMCAAAIFWSSIGRVVYAIGKERFHAIAQTNNPAHLISISAKDLLKHGERKVIVEGPLLEEEAAHFYKAIFS
jgi:tRNA(Arg) A34 adenosine deaminase TadA